MTAFYLYLLTVIICIPVMVFLNYIHDDQVTIHDLAMCVIFGVIPFSNIVVMVVMAYVSTKRIGMFGRLSDWWDRVGQTRVL